MTKKTIIQKLKRSHEMVEANILGGDWWVNPNRHPLPTLPNQDYLEGKYLEQIRKSNPELVETVTDLVARAKTERWSEPTEYPRDRNMI